MNEEAEAAPVASVAEDEDLAGCPSIGQAAGTLGISERRLRRILERPEYAAGIRRITRRTASGVRIAAVLAPDTYERIKTILDAGEKKAAGKNAAIVSGDDPDSNRHEAASKAAQGGGAAYPPPIEEPASGAEPLTDGERGLLRELVGQLREENRRLNAALEKSQTLQLATLGEMQNLRERYAALEQQNARLIQALPAPDEPDEAKAGIPEGRAVEAPESAGNDSTGKTARPGFWARLWGRKDGRQ